ncbi:ribonuclease P protein component [Luteimonas aestuarii]|uniref:Ribonuclease P protein component n=1 Tax=Luteimonas aestuarii TaxID=453837 RepID=A0A4R5TQB9_9GAMM|nr:ribonuclease P protein component [Luteimonas aestuarii]TDK19059.1 ribonuclease P protein component [Luteimonas aestuarii]
MRTGDTPPQNDHRFPRQARVRARPEFDLVFKDGRRTATPLLAVHWLRDAAPPRLGLAVSRKVDTRAVERNRIKRNLRETFRALRPALSPGAYVVVARNAASGQAPMRLRGAFTDALRRAGALPPECVDGTMPPASPPPTTTPQTRGE